MAVRRAVLKAAREAAKLVKKVRNGVYQINPMLAGYNSPEDALDAVKARLKVDRLDSKTYVTDYHRAVAAYLDQLAEQRKKRAAAAAVKKGAAEEARFAARRQLIRPACSHGHRRCTLHGRGADRVQSMQRSSTLRAA
ncbi:hypothetical protein ACF09E_32770 [Streptomyces sp. NPDC014891]|uniref:hypothetical protein n=1 Tax=Streptomyces sp. NPDC014891 TaxID=3364929 RepID=UPI0036F5AFA9